ncbi:NADP-dependent mannitol dehydrogenase [Verticillium alfalfae VaMs.102]|uniref:NADP-dependent mannitol dehydrogenase n=1 Tax=Verticillium alfalfae (strain VaMs.102 / ATCC MYA-4576 / FGSC 10136) TaxID=526221 RepID=C9S5H7_VERA1|nr:NADP-dependent mannitol dehydrogenase [Verticillium alfalfae VaMs.102]EEY15054.1 NADP-dependent mannitol dehydrogenase [Verticillium alfalfae VaMs.102]
MAPPAATSDIALPASPEYPLPEQKDPLASSTPVTNLFSLSSKTIAITGGGRGLGITFALAVLEAGGHPACLDILESPSPVEWAHLTKLAAARGQHVSYHRCDVTDEDATRAVLEDIDAAAQARGAPFGGTIACAGIQQKTARILVERKREGSVVLIASMSGQIANRGLTCSAYNTSKAAVQQMCRSLAQEWGQYGIRVNTLSPGYIRTAMTDELLAAEPEVEKTWMHGAMLNRLGVPEDFKAPAVFLLSEGSRFMTGADLRVDGGHCASA